MHKLNIQMFALHEIFDEQIKSYQNTINDTQNKINTLNTNKQNELNTYNQNYQSQLDTYNKLAQNQQDYIDRWAETTKQNQQKQTDYETAIIEQNKKDAAEQTDKTIKGAYTSYMKQNNQFGGALENLVTNGLATSGLAESSKIGIYNTYQNSVSTAKESLMKANRDYDNQIQQALLNNDSKLAEIALQQLQKSYDLSLQNFEYTQDLYNTKISFEQNLNSRYDNLIQNEKSRIDNYYRQIDSLKQSSADYQKWEKEFEEQKRQFNEQMRASYSGGSGGSYSGGSYYDYSSGGSSSSSSGGGNKSKANTYGNSASVRNKGDYYFSNGYQPRYVNNGKLSSTGVTVGKVLGNTLGKGRVDQNIWYTNGRYYVWLGKNEGYKDITSYKKKIEANSSWWNGLWHKGVGWFG